MSDSAVSLTNHYVENENVHHFFPLNSGRYDIKIFQTFFQLHGKTFDYKIPMSTVLRLFLLPHKDNRQMFFVLSLDPPIKQGQTRYHYLVLLFSMEEETSIELPFSDTELKEKYEDKLTKDLSGPVYEVLGKLISTFLFDIKGRENLLI